MLGKERGRAGRDNRNVIDSDRLFSSIPCNSSSGWVEIGDKQKGRLKYSSSVKVSAII